MVEVEEIVDETPEPEAPAARETTEDGWEKLMGEDILMKVTDTSPPVNDKEAEAVKPEDTVIVDIVGRLADDRSTTDGPIFQKIKGWLVVVGEGDVLPSVEMAIRFMKTGQTCQVWSHSKFAFGNGVRQFEKSPIVPRQGNVMFEIKVGMIVIDTSQLNPYFTIQKAVTRKDIANDIYQNEWCPPAKTADDPSSEAAMARAIRLYTKAAKAMDTLLDGTYFAQVEQDHPQREQVKKVLLDSLNNIVAVYMQQQEYHKAKLSSVEVLKQDPRNLKGLLRAAKSSLLDRASTLEEVEAALDAAESEITYKNPDEEKELKKLKALFKQKRNEYKQRSKAMFGNMLKKNALSTEETKSEKETTSAEEKTEKAAPLEKTAPTVESDKTVDAAASDSSEFWKLQLWNMGLQIGLPLVGYLIYFLFFKKSGEAPSPPESEYDMPVYGEEDLGTIDLD